MENNFRISFRESEDEPYPFAAADLLDLSTGASIINLQAAQLGNPDQRVVGTLFAKRYSVLFMGLISAISLFDFRLASAPSDVRFRMTNQASMEYQTKLELPSIVSQLDSKERSVIVAEYFYLVLQHTENIFDAVSALTGSSVKVMWSLISHNLQNFYARMESNRSIWGTKERLQLIMADWDILMAPRCGNPLTAKFRSFPHPLHPESAYYLRRYCCLAYQLKNTGTKSGYCGTCPKLSFEERLEILSEENDV